MKFNYSLDLLEDCAKYDHDLGCWELFNLHAKHYGYQVNDDSKDTFLDGERFLQFKENVKQVYDHNHEPSSLFQQELNRYSHLNEQELASLGIMHHAGGVEDATDEQGFYYKVSKENIISESKMKSSAFNWQHFTIEAKKHSSLSKNKVDEILNKIKSGFQNSFSVSDEDLSTNLNWATNLNPDGISIVNSPQNQGTCGSCWAFSATGTIEANVARNVAFLTYGNSVLKRVANGDFIYTNATQVNEILDECRQEAQVIEQEAFSMASLSVQELIDCDTKYDLGCVGGNPLLAFTFIAKYGLTSSDDYPYVEHQESCQADKKSNPIVKITSFGILPSNDENFLAKVLLELGPVAVGFSVDKSFLSYGGGIFHSNKCDQDPNHALLLVGYGQEEGLGPNGNQTKKYWIARNSWSTDWGENGYVRVLRRSSNHTHTEDSMCGIAIDPSIALGSYFVPGYFHINDLNTPSMSFIPEIATKGVLPIEEGGLPLSSKTIHILLVIVIFIAVTVILCKPFSWYLKRIERKREEEAEALIKVMVKYGSNDDSFIDPRKSDSFNAKT